MERQTILLKDVLLSALCLATCTMAQAQNLVTNPDFDVDVSAWSPNGAVIAFDSTQNAAGAAGSGAISVTNNIGNGITVSVAQCISSPLSAGTYDFGGWLLFPTGQAGTGTAGVSASLFASTDCTGNSLAFSNATGVPVGGWNLHTLMLVAPAGVFSAAIVLRIDTPPNGPAPMTAWFDGVRFGPAPTTPVELQNFDVE